MIGRFKIAAALLLCCTALPSWAQHAHEPGATSPLVQSDPYAHGLFQLHNFEYSSAAEAFRAAQSADPANVMAYWGEAMTYNHPLWAEQDAGAARAVLARLGATPAQRRAKARNAREAMWLDAVEALYGEGTKIERDVAYHGKMKALFDAAPDDIDARAFYALSTLGLAHEGRDTALYMRSAAILEEAFPAHPRHPGLLHYMIHSYDDPAHAPLGERAAERYATVAPEAGHAQHMISHIYLALGRWDAVEKANVAANAVVDRQRGGKGYCGHYSEWLIYALDQQGKDSAAEVDGCQSRAVATLARAEDKSVLGDVRSPFNSWATIAVRHGVDTGRWPDWNVVPAGDNSAYGRFQLAYGRMLASGEDPAGATAALADMKRHRARIVEAIRRERPDDHESAAWLDRAVEQGEAVVALASGRQTEGLKLLQAAAEAESALPVPFGPPILAKPSWELLGDELLAHGRKDEAADAYRRALAAAPGRRLAVAGLEAASR